MRRRSYGPRPVVTSIKNSTIFGGGLSGTSTVETLAKAVNTPASTVDTDVSNGCIIKAIYMSVDICGLGGTGVLNIGQFYLFKNPGSNLTPPAPVSVGASNEKKFVFREWTYMIMRNQDGNAPTHWEGWVKIPKRYQRMGTDDQIQMVFQCSASITGHISIKSIYKWYR